MATADKIMITAFIIGIIIGLVGWVVYKIRNEDDNVVCIVFLIDCVLIGVPVLYAGGKAVYMMLLKIWRL